MILIISPKHPGNSGLAFREDEDCGLTSDSTLAEARVLCDQGQATFLGSWFKCDDCGFAVLERDNERISVVRETTTYDEGNTKRKEATHVGYICGPRLPEKNPDGTWRKATKQSCYEIRKRKQFETMFTKPAAAGEVKRGAVVQLPYAGKKAHK